MPVFLLLRFLKFRRSRAHSLGANAQNLALPP